MHFFLDTIKDPKLTKLPLDAALLEKMKLIVFFYSIDERIISSS